MGDEVSDESSKSKNSDTTSTHVSSNDIVQPSAPREWTITRATDYIIGPMLGRDESVTVVERAAYDAVKAERDELRAIINKHKLHGDDFKCIHCDNLHSAHVCGPYIEYQAYAEAKAQVVTLTEALRDIAKSCYTTRGAMDAAQAALDKVGAE